MLQNLLCLCKKKTQVVFFPFFISSKFEFNLYECPGIDQVIHKGKTQSCSKMKNKKKLLGFFYINIANFGSFSLGQKVERQSLFSEE